MLEGQRKEVMVPKDNNKPVRTADRPRHSDPKGVNPAGEGPAQPPKDIPTKLERPKDRGDADRRDGA